MRISGESSTATGTATHAAAVPMIAARAIPSEKQLRPGKAERPQGRKIGRVQVGLPCQRMPHNGKPRQPDEHPQRPQPMDSSRIDRTIPAV